MVLYTYSFGLFMSTGVSGTAAAVSDAVPTDKVDN